jgi:dihydroxyacetone kinase
MPPTRPDPKSSPPDHLINAYLHSLTLTNPNLTLDATNKTLSVRPAPNQTRTVSVISGSAINHSPYIASFVGPGLLTACISTNSPVASDPVEHVRIAIQERALTTQRVLFIVPQYGDDEVIVEDAALSAKCHDLTMQFEQLTAPSTLVLGPGPDLGARPGAGLPLLLKICSAVAARGYSLQEVLRVGRLVIKNLLSVSSNLRLDLNDSDPDRSVEPDMSFRVRAMVSRMLDPNLRNPGFVEVNSNEVVLHISGHSRITMLEMGAITSEAVKQMEYWHIQPVRIYTESVSELSVLGREGFRYRDFAITLLNVCNTDIGGPSMIQLLDAPAEAAGWTAFVKGKSWEAKNTRSWERNMQWVRPSGLKCNPQVIWRAAMNGSRAIVAFTKGNKLVQGYPIECWYGDAGAPTGQNDHAQDIWSIAKGTPICSCKFHPSTDIICSTGAIKALASLPALSDDMVILMNDMLSATAPALDNPFGALVTIFFIALIQSFRKQSETADEVNVGLWVYALEDAFQELSQYANHRPAMASMLGALDTFMQTLHSTGDLSKAAKAAEQSPGAATDTGARLLCAFFAGLAGPVNGRLEQGSVGEEKPEVGEEERQQGQAGKEVEAEADHSSTEGNAVDGLQAEVLDQSLQEESSPVPNAGEVEQSTTSAEEKHLVTSDAATVSPASPEPPTKEPASRQGMIASLGAALGLTSREATPQEAKPVPTDEGQVTEASRDAIVDALQIKRSDFDAAIEGIRSRERVPLPTRQIEETTLLDMVRQQIETLGVSSKEEAGAEKDEDEEEYELV